jgi:RNA polymerase sigma factor (TIGR02999 family)
MTREMVTQLLLEAEHGDRAVLDRILPLVYAELERLAQQHLRRERGDHTLTPTALVHEAYLRLVDQERAHWQSRGHFLAIASLAMRRILVNHARDRRRLKREGSQQKVTLETGMDFPLPEGAPQDRDEQVVQIDTLLERLAAFDERAAKVVECRFFGGLTIEETADALQIAPMTVKRAWRLAKTWLQRELAAG